MASLNEPMAASHGGIESFDGPLGSGAQPGGLRATDKVRFLASAGTDPRLTAVAHQVVKLLVQHFNLKTGQCNPSIERLAELAQRCERAVRKAIKLLAKLGWIEITTTIESRTKKRNNYRPCFERIGIVHLPDTTGGDAPAPERLPAAADGNDRSQKAERAFQNPRNGCAGDKGSKRGRENRGAGKRASGQRGFPEPSKKEVREARSKWEPRLAAAFGDRGTGYQFLMDLDGAVIDALCVTLETGQISMAEAVERAVRSMGTP